MGILRSAAASLVLVAVAAGLGRAQTAEDLAGTWKRVPDKDNPTPRYFRLAANGDRLEGPLLNPPEGLTATVALGVAAGGKVEGKATWVDGTFHEDALWELHLDQGALVGRSEWLDWEKGTVFSRGWEDHRFERVARVGLVTAGTKAEAPFGDPVPLASLAGGWLGLGGPWEVRVDGGSLLLVPVGHHDGVRIELKDERGTLRGTATLPGGATSKVELAHEEGKLSGRAEWVEGQDLGDMAQRGWSPFELTRLARIDGKEGAPEGAAPQGVPGELEAGVYRREDGLYLRVHPEGGQTVGVLCAKDGTARARVRFEHKGELWIGTANFDGVEARWELVVFTGLGDPGTPGPGLNGRCEWVDAHEGRAVARGFVDRTFTKLRRVH